ncbi:UNVERIFIED_CONTAM: hypothetical protein RMT77_006210 [Armadillidium vulgare]
MASEIGSIQPNPYIFNIENRKKRKPHLAHEMGAGAKCRKCGDKCSGFQLHFWRKICLNCRCGKDDHEVEDDEEDIGKIVIGKLFERPIRTKEEEESYSYGTDLEMVNDFTGEKEKVKFDWVPPGVGRAVAKRYMEMLPPEKRPVAGSQAAKERRRQLEQQIPLYDMDESERCESLPPAELKNFKKYLENLRTRVAGQGSVKEIASPTSHIHPSIGQPFTSSEEFPPPPQSWIGNRSPTGTGSNEESMHNLNNTLNNNANLPVMDNRNYGANNMIKDFGGLALDKNLKTDTPESTIGPHIGSSFVKSRYTPVQSEFAIPGYAPDQSAQPVSDSSYSGDINAPNSKASKSSVIQLTTPKPFIAKSEQQAIKPGQFSTTLGYRGKIPESPQQHHGSQISEPHDNYNKNTSPQKHGGSLPHFVPKIGGVISSTAEQSPYNAQKEKLYGQRGTNAAADNVTVLFPHESERLAHKKEIPAHSVDDYSTPSQFSCQYCKQAMFAGDVAVICERAGPGKFWHPKCFVCVTCKEILADLIYFYKDGQVFCGRHYTEAADIPRCKACDELIFGETWTRADGHDWHIHHFCCFICDHPLAGSQYIPDEKDFPHCMSCFMSFKAKMCETCEDKISPKQTRTGYNGYYFHARPECFACYQCKTSLMGRRFKMVKNWVFCSQDCVLAAEREIAMNPNPKSKEN